MNVKRITPVLLVKEIEPVVPFWVGRLGFTKTIEVPDGNNIGFITFQKGSTEVMYQTYSSVEKDAPPAMSAEARKGPTYLYMEVDNFEAVRAAMKDVGMVMPVRTTLCRHERRRNGHARAHYLLRHEGIRGPGPRRPLHHLCPTRGRAPTLTPR